MTLVEFSSGHGVAIQTVLDQSRRSGRQNLRVAQDSVNTKHEGGLQLYSEAIQVFLKRYEAEDRIENLESEVRFQKREKLTQ